MVPVLSDESSLPDLRLLIPSCDGDRRGPAGSLL